ncbi:MAG: hypothetical protein ACI92E_003058, partial [Oceanicoccus sp.]
MLTVDRPIFFSIHLISEIFELQRLIELFGTQKC